MIVVGGMRAQVQAWRLNVHARTLWSRSRDHGLEHRFTVSDGDSKAINSVWDVYGGVCSDGDKYERMEQSSPDYIK